MASGVRRPPAEERACCAMLRACVTASSVPRSCCMYPRTVSTRFGIRSCRRLSCTSICAQAFCASFRNVTSPLYVATNQSTSDDDYADHDQDDDRGTHFKPLLLDRGPNDERGERRCVERSLRLRRGTAARRGRRGTARKRCPLSAPAARMTA